MFACIMLHAGLWRGYWSDVGCPLAFEAETGRSSCRHFLLLGLFSPILLAESIEVQLFDSTRETRFGAD
jgi:hypothetical protein